MKLGALIWSFICALIPGAEQIAPPKHESVPVTRSKPNFVVIQTDDQARSLIYAKYKKNGRMAAVMPNVMKLAREGTDFTNYYASSPVCGPSRASFLSGQYSHNTGVVGNSGRHGGWEGWKNSPIHDKNLVTDLQDAGYQTMHFGKYTNFYGSLENDTVPPGWDVWMTDWSDTSTGFMYGYKLRRHIPRLGIDDVFRNTGPETYGPGEGYDPGWCDLLSRSRKCRHHTDVISRGAVDEIEAADQPFYLQLDFHAPHGDVSGVVGPDPPTRFLGKARNTPLPADMNFNEKNTQDKPFLLRKNGRLKFNDRRRIKLFYRSTLESLMGIDQAVGKITRALRKTGQLDNTYIVFTSDNGFFMGDHRFIAAKFLAHEESSNVPFLIRGPGVPTGASRANISTTDFAPTVLDLAGVSPSYTMDGVSVERFWKRPTAKSLRPILIEFTNIRQRERFRYRKEKVRFLPRNRPAAKAPPLKYRAIKIGDFKLTRYFQGGTELYDLSADPAELTNLAFNPAYKQVLVFMKRNLRRYRDCAGEECAKNAPVLGSG